uniref:Uncharacterized protein n=1 Tax=Arundo donax TaxID=35708 RepID=A0A0A9B6D1_ARUDO
MNQYPDDYLSSRSWCTRNLIIYAPSHQHHICYPLFSGCSESAEVILLQHRQRESAAAWWVGYLGRKSAQE